MTRRIDPTELPWIALADGVRCKSAIHHGRQIRLLEFAHGFIEKQWCAKGHIGYVLNGTLEVAFEHDVQLFSPGDILVIQEGDQHRARVIAGPVVLFLVEEALR